MKKKLTAALLVCLTLCSCSVYEEEIKEYNPYEQTDTETSEETEYDNGNNADIPSYTPSNGDTAADAPVSADTFPAENADTLSPAAETSLPADVPSAPTPVTAAPTEETKKEKRIAVPFYSQQEYPTGCELVCASMLLAYYGYNIAPCDLINAGYVGTGSVHEDFMNPGTFYGSDPNKVFIGDPNSIYNYSYGCYSGAILAGLKKYLAAEMFDTVDISGLTLNDLCIEYIDWDQPVLIWASNNMEATHCEDNNKWFIEETGEPFEWISNEHCLVLVGYDEENYCFHDPINGAYTLYPRDISEQRYRELGSQAITIHPWTS